MATTTRSRTPKPTPNPTKPKTLVVGDNLICQTSDGELSIPLRFKTKLLRGLIGAADDMTAFFAILDGMGTQELIDALDELDIEETSQIMSDWWDEVHDRNGASAGNSVGSSN